MRWEGKKLSIAQLLTGHDLKNIIHSGVVTSDTDSNRPGYWSNLSYGWPSTAYFEQETENESWTNSESEYFHQSHGM